MDGSDYATHRMIICSECKRTEDNDGCRGTNNEIDNCIDATAPMEESYYYGG